MKTIFHYGGWSRNYGDMSIQHGMINKLMSISKYSLNFVPIDLKESNELSFEDVDYINQHGDALIVGGGGMIMRGDGIDTVSGWQFNISLDNLARLKIPLIIYGIGLNVFPYERDLEEKALEHLYHTALKSNLFSVRNEGTKTFLRDIGIHSKIKIIPDPGMFIKPYDISLPFNKSDYLIGICWAGDRYIKRFKTVHVINEIEKISEVCKRILEVKGGGKVVWIPHVSIYDLQAAFSFREFLKDDFFDVSEHYPNMYPERYFYIQQLAGIYKRMNIVISLRGHGNIISFGQCTKCIAYGDHKKVQFFSEEVVTPYLKSSCTENELFEEMLKLSDDRLFDMTTRGKILDLNNYIMNFNQEILKLIGASWLD